MPSQTPPLDFESLHPYLEITDIYICSSRLFLRICMLKRFVHKETTVKLKKHRFISHVNILG